ncbi:hypothetical protein B0A48_11214 [Cryoendolithus antarcticus]|uniref:Uncharacterized protein n=1 Tax=Cryoendolithus antarcticus TaxID=1507870 RepID=A0A1V8SV69_9PEZI|nr:hypothetical protein B0A48_11214 [Cryoendolithus antarcticus]
MDWPPELPSGPLRTPTTTVLKSDEAKGKTPLNCLKPIERLRSKSVNEHTAATQPDNLAGADARPANIAPEPDQKTSPASSLQRFHTYDNGVVTDELSDDLRSPPTHPCLGGSPSRSRSLGGRSGTFEDSANAASSLRGHRLHEDGIEVDEAMGSTSSHTAAVDGRSSYGGFEGSDDDSPINEAERAVVDSEELRRQHRFEELILRGLWWC